MRKSFSIQDRVSAIYLCTPQIFNCECCGRPKEDNETKWSVFLNEWTIVGGNLAGEYAAVRGTDSRIFPAEDLFYGRAKAETECDNRNKREAKDGH